MIDLEAVPLVALDANRGLLQSGFWGAFRQGLGWEARGVRGRYGEQSFRLLVLSRPLPGGPRLGYLPHGPEVAEPLLGRELFLAELARSLRAHLPGTVFLRYDLPWGRRGEGNRPPPLADDGPLRKAPMDVQPPSTVLVELGESEERLLAAMKPKTRYNVRLAEKKGVTVEEGGAEALPEWYHLYRETARRDRITLHSLLYYRRLFELAASYGPGAPELHLLLARHQGELLAGIIVALRGERAWYLYGASSSRKRSLMPSHALQWRAMLLARERGCRSYDLFGIPPGADPSHPMHGLYRFKTGFGGLIFNRLGCYDFPYRRLLYGAYRLGERARAGWYRGLRKRLPRRPSPGAGAS
jgi:lipid II:glycine glycyltransferase (peptidoglycan interpeptide bridge formation enzyme)